MGSKSSGIHSVRVPNELWNWLVEEAKRRGVTPNGLVVDLLSVGRFKSDERRLAPANPEQITKPRTEKATPAAKPAPVKSPANPAKVSVSVPFGADVVRKPYQKGTKK